MIKIGKILKKHGFGYDIEAKLHFLKNKEINEKNIPFLHIALMENTKVPYRVKSIKQLHNGNFSILFDRMFEEEDVENILQKEVYLDFTEQNKQDQNLEDYTLLIGMKLWNDEQELGIIEDVYDLDPYPLLVLHLEDKELLIPLVEEWIIALDWERREITFELPEGLLDI